MGEYDLQVSPFVKDRSFRYIADQWSEDYMIIWNCRVNSSCCFQMMLFLILNQMCAWI